eukprot:scaffold72977_cov87-Cyclotella_meneghiniana.AAC.2
MIAQYTWDLRRQLIKKHDTPPQTDINLNDLPPSILGSFFMCDGQPAFQLSNIIAIDNRRFYCGDTTASSLICFQILTTATMMNNLTHGSLYQLSFGGLTGTCKSPCQCLSRFYGLF